MVGIRVLADIGIQPSPSFNWVGPWLALGSWLTQVFSHLHLLPEVDHGRGWSPTYSFQVHGCSGFQSFLSSTLGIGWYQWLCSSQNHGWQRNSLLYVHPTSSFTSLGPGLIVSACPSSVKGYCGRSLQWVPRDFTTACEEGKYPLSRNKILGHQLNNRLESFAPCHSKSLLQADFKENHPLVLKIRTKNPRNKETRVWEESSLPATSTKNAVQEFHLING